MFYEYFMFRTFILDLEQTIRNYLQKFNKTV